MKEKLEFYTMKINNKRQKTTEIEVEEEKKEKGDIKGKKIKKNTAEKNELRDTVFYNPVQEFNRDLSILCITEYGKQLQKVKSLII